MESKVEAVLARKKSSSFPADDGEEEHAMAMASSSSASSAAIFAFLAPPLSLLRHVASLCANYLDLDGGGLKPSTPAPATWSSSAAAATSEDRTELVLEVRSRGFTPPKQHSTPRESRVGAAGGVHH